MLSIEGLRSLQRPTYLQTPIGGHHHQLRSLDLVGQLTTLRCTWNTPKMPKMAKNVPKLHLGKLRNNLDLDPKFKNNWGNITNRQCHISKIDANIKWLTDWLTSLLERLVALIQRCIRYSSATLYKLYKAALCEPKITALSPDKDTKTCIALTQQKNKHTFKNNNCNRPI